LPKDLNECYKDPLYRGTCFDGTLNITEYGFIIFLNAFITKKIIYLNFNDLWLLQLTFTNMFWNCSKVVAGATTLSTTTSSIMTFIINVTQSIMTFNILAEYCYAECDLCLGVIYIEYRKYSLHAGCLYAECSYAQCRYS